MAIQSLSAYVNLRSLVPGERHPVVASANLDFTDKGQLPLTKCVVTVGPSCRSPEMLEALIQAGATGFRYNMSHVNDEALLIDTLKSVLTTRYIANKLGRQVAIIADMQGAEFRVQSSEDFDFRVGDRVQFTTEHGQSHRENGSVVIHLRAPEEYQLIRDMRKNNKDLLSKEKNRPFIYIDDGNVAIELDPLNTWTEKTFWGTVRHGSKIKTNKGVNFPGLVLPNLPPMTKADYEVMRHVFDKKFVTQIWEGYEKEEPELGKYFRTFLEQGALNLLGFDYVAPSFVRKYEDLDCFKHFLQANCSNYVRLIPKIETREAVHEETLISLLAHPLSLGVMVARGDLQAQVGADELPYYQRLILEKAREAGKFSIVATDVLGSMTEGNIRATRAEHDGLFAMAEHGAHAFMLSNETAAGKHPDHVVRYGLATFQNPKVEKAISPSKSRQAQRAHILMMAEEALKKIEPLEEYRQEDLYFDTMKACLTPRVDGFVLWSERGNSMRRAVQILPDKPLYVVTNNPHVAREGAMTRGVFPILLKRKPDDRAEFDAIIEQTIPAPLGQKADGLKVIHNLG